VKRALLRPQARPHSKNEFGDPSNHGMIARTAIVGGQSGAGYSGRDTLHAPARVQLVAAQPGGRAMRVLAGALWFAAALATLAPVTVRAEILIGAAAQLTGDYSWLGEQVERGAVMAVDDLNKAGGVLGEQVRLILVDDYCRGDQAVPLRGSSSLRAWSSLPAIHAQGQLSLPRRSTKRRASS
jgi:Periplasmic binding protein